NYPGIKSFSVRNNFKKTYPKDLFYFIDFKYSFRIDTSLRYSGILYSNNLKKLRYPDGVHINLKADEDGSASLKDYEALFLRIEVEKMLKEKIKEVLKEKFYVKTLVGVTPNVELFERVLLEKKRTNLYTTNIYIFVDNLDEINVDEYRKKVCELVKIIDMDLNIYTSLNVCIKDDRFFENYKSVEYQIFPPFRNERKTKKILNKIKTKKKLSNDEKISLIEVLSLDYYYDSDIMIEVPELGFSIDKNDKKIQTIRYR
ncbi:MAG: hypothetical protein ACRDBY_06775, partial [Cetobacterium sp.]